MQRLDKGIASLFDSEVSDTYKSSGLERGADVNSAAGASGAAVSSIHEVSAQPKADRCAPHPA